MAIDKHDPLRPLLLAVNAARVLGCLSFALGLLTLLMIRLLGGAAGSGAGFVFWIVAIAVTATLIAPGILYLVFATFMRRFQSWAVVATLVVASMHGALMSISVVTNLAGGRFDFSAMFLGILIIVAALLVVHCARSFRVIREHGPRREAGFEPLMPVPVQPLPPAPPDQDPTAENP